MLSEHELPKVVYIDHQDYISTVWSFGGKGLDFSSTV